VSVLGRAIVRALPLVPRPLVRRVASRYVAGETLADALAVVRRLEREGCLATLDVLGEDVASPAEVEATVSAYRDALDALAREKLPANVSIKLTALGLKQDGARCRAALARVVEAARAHGSFVRIDMEDSSVTEETIAIFEELHARGAPVGLVLQAYLRRTDADVARAARVRANVRVCKGIYVEPPEIAFQDREEIRDSFARSVERLLEAGCRVGIATHDLPLVERALSTIARLRLARDDYEFQMLLGVGADLRKRLVAAGHRLRVYVPFGRSWYAYSVRRLKENPAIATQVLGAVLRRGR
jgi:proline dehydrogenase